jgi:hypothetical protein
MNSVICAIPTICIEYTLSIKFAKTNTCRLAQIKKPEWTLDRLLYLTRFATSAQIHFWKLENIYDTAYVVTGGPDVVFVYVKTWFDLCYDSAPLKLKVLLDILSSL